MRGRSSLTVQMNPLQGQDAISTSSSTLVNAEHDSKGIATMGRETTHEGSRSSSRSANASMASGSETIRPSSGLTRQRGNRRSYPDDHRCSDQEIEGGLCSCMRAASQSSESERENGKSELAESYERKLFLARKRKLLSDGGTKAIADNSRQRDEALHHHREFASDPAEAQQAGEHIPSRSRQRPLQVRRASSPIRTPSSPARENVHQRFSASISESSRHNQAMDKAQTAARKSISSVYERLLREEEERREDERMKREAARRRRRNESIRRQEDSLLFERLTKQTERKGAMNVMEEVPTNPSSKEDDLNMPPFTSPILAVSPPSTQDVSLSDEIARQALSDQHKLLHPADASNGVATYATRLAALRSSHASTLAHEAKLEVNMATLQPAWSHVEQQAAYGKGKDIRPPSPLAAASPVSTDSVRSFTFPNRSSPTPSWQGLSPRLLHSPNMSPEGGNAGGSDGTPLTSPRRNGHRRLTDQTLSVSARTPVIQEESKLAVEPMERAQTNAEVNKSTDVSTRRVKFSPRPEIISSFPLAEDFAGDDTGINEEEEEQMEEEEAEGAGQQLATGTDALINASSQELFLSQSVIKEEDKIDLDAVHVSLPNLDAESPKQLRGSPMKRTMASPHVPGTYLSPLPPKITPGSPPLLGKPPQLDVHRSSKPPRSRSWNANSSFSDTSLSGELGMVEEDQVTEGSLSTTHSAPLTSTPPRPSKSVTGSDASQDDSVRLTLDQLNVILRRREESKEMSVQTEKGAESSMSDAIAVLADVKNEQLDDENEERRLTYDQADQEYVRRVEAARQRLTKIAKSYRLRPFPLRSVERGIPWTTLIIVSLVFMQIAFAAFMTAAAHAKAEQMYFALHHQGHHPLLTMGDDFLVFAPKTFGGVLRPVLLEWGLLPDIGQLWTSGHSDTLIAVPWYSLLLSTFRNILRPSHFSASLRILLARLAFQFGLYGSDAIPVVHSLPT